MKSQFLHGRELLHSFPAFLLLLSIVTYGIFIPFLGFYWDDQLITAVYSAEAFHYLKEFWQSDRPAQAYFYFAIQSIVSENPIGWHIVSLLLRWLTTALIWWLGRSLFQQRDYAIAAIACLFLVYPGFRCQSLSVAYSVNFLHLALMLTSLLLMVYALKTKIYFIFCISGSLITALLSMLLNEYYIGFELLRPVLIGFVLSESSQTINLGKRIRKIVRLWLPYIVLGISVLWIKYFFISVDREEVNPLGLIRNAWEDSGMLWFTMKRIGLILPDIVNATLLSWFQAFTPSGNNTGSIYGRWGPMVGLVCGCLCYWKLREKSREIYDGRKYCDIFVARWLLLIGLSVFVCGALTIWLSGVNTSISVMHGRFTFPIMLGSSIIIFAILQLSITSRRLHLGILACLVGLGAGIQVEAQNDFRRSWTASRDFFSQLYFRAPNIEPGTVLLIDYDAAPWDIVEPVYYDFAVPLNYLYSDKFIPDDLQYWTSLNNNRYEGGKKSSLLREIQKRFSGQVRNVKFEVVGEQILAVTYYPNGCLRVLDKNSDYSHTTGSNIEELAQYSDVSLIKEKSIVSMNERKQVYINSSPKTWCYFFQKAELANQFGRWKETEDLLAMVRKLGLAAADSEEWSPFLRAYKNLGKTNLREQLVAEIRKSDPMFSERVD